MTSRFSSERFTAEASAAQFVADLLDATIRRSERWICVARAIFCVAVLARRASWGGLWDGHRIPPGAWLMVPAVLATLVFSIWLGLRTRRAHLGLPLLFASVAVDAVVCFLGLAANALFPYPEYQGIAAHPDAIALMLMIAVAGFRLSPKAAAFGAALNVLSFAALIVLDQVFVSAQLHPRSGGYFLIGMCLLFAAALAVVVARRAQSMATDTARAALDAERAHSSLGTLLEEHHDVKSTLSAALLNAELMQRELSERGVLDGDGAKHAAELTRELMSAQQAMRRLRAKVLGEAATLDLPATVNVKDAVDRAAGIVAVRHPQIALVFAIDDGVRVRVAGGVPAMERIALNLLLNACEGDGIRGARVVRVSAAEHSGVIALVIDDDGPGLANKPSRGSLKPDGSGLGLLIVEALVGASGGSLQLGEGPHGVRACVRLTAVS